MLLDHAAGFYNDLAVDALARDPENASVTFIHSAPGTVNTPWGREMPTPVRWLIRGLQVFMRSADECAEFMCDALLNPSKKAAGMVLVDKNADPAKLTTLHSDEAREHVWKHTMEVLTRTAAT